MRSWCAQGRKVRFPRDHLRQCDNEHLIMPKSYYLLRRDGIASKSITYDEILTLVEWEESQQVIQEDLLR